MPPTDRELGGDPFVTPNVRAKVAPAVWRAGTAAQNWGEAPAPQAQCATPLGLSLSEGLGLSPSTDNKVASSFDAPGYGNHVFYSLR
jgi:hypothetical protein